jgi:copper chaperone CopZ
MTAETIELSYSISGAHCDHCRHAIKQEVGKVPGVRGVEVDLGAGAVRVLGHGLDYAAIRDAIDEPGFNVG